MIPRVYSDNHYCNLIVIVKNMLTMHNAYVHSAVSSISNSLQLSCIKVNFFRFLSTPYYLVFYLYHH